MSELPAQACALEPDLEISGCQQMQKGDTAGQRIEKVAW